VLEAVQQVGDSASPELGAQFRAACTPLVAAVETTSQAAPDASPKPLDDLRRAANKARAHLESVRTGILAAHKRLAKAEAQLLAARDDLTAKEALFAPAEEAAASSEEAYREGITAAAAAAGATHGGAHPVGTPAAKGDVVIIFGGSPVTEDAAAQLKRVLDAYEARKAKRQCAGGAAADAVGKAVAGAAGAQRSS
jgi:hypothetical protein